MIKFGATVKTFLLAIIAVLGFRNRRSRDGGANHRHSYHRKDRSSSRQIRLTGFRRRTAGTGSSPRSFPIADTSKESPVRIRRFRALGTSSTSVAPPADSRLPQRLWWGLLPAEYLDLSFNLESITVPGVAECDADTDYAEGADLQTGHLHSHAERRLGRRILRGREGSSSIPDLRRRRFAEQRQGRVLEHAASKRSSIPSAKS